jgi:glycerate dehydrogenase
MSTSRGEEKGVVCSLLNTDKLNWDGSLSFEYLKRAVSSLELHERTTTDQALGKIHEGVSVLVTKEMEMDASIIEKLPKSVRLICEAGTGFNNIDGSAAKTRGIAVCNVPEYSTEAVATMVMTFVLSFSCSLMQQQRKLWRGGNEDRKEWTTLQGLSHFELAGKTIGLIGGRGLIGSKVSEMARAFGLKVLISSRSSKPCEGATVVSLDDLLYQSDFVSIHCPLNDSTRKSIGKSHFEKMGPDSFLINTARGGIVNESELCDALESNRIAGAGLDVQEAEPPAPESKLWELAQKNKVILTPHIGWQRKETRQRLVDAVAQNIEEFLKGNPQNVVN